MKSALRLELVWDTFFFLLRRNRLTVREYTRGMLSLGVDKQETYVIEIPGNNPVKCTRDYSEAKSNGDRGIYGIYILESCKFYKVHERISYKETRTYFCIVCGWDIKEISEQEVYACLKKDSLV